MTDKVETRRVQFSEFEVRSTTGDDSDYMSFRGYAAVFNSPSQPLPFVETVMPGAFSKSLRSRNNIRMYQNHDSNMLLATTRAGTLRLQEDSKGLLVDADLPPTSIGRDLSILMQRGDVDSMSFGFSVPRGGDNSLGGSVTNWFKIQSDSASAPIVEMTVECWPNYLLLQLEREKIYKNPTDW